MEEQDKSMKFQDVTLLMEAYKNNIVLTTALLEQQKQVLVQQVDIISNQKTINSELIVITKAIKDIQTSTLEKSNEIFKEVLTNYNDIRLEIVKENSTLKNMMYVAWIGCASIIASLITIIINMSSKFSILGAIANKLGVGGG